MSLMLTDAMGHPMTLRESLRNWWYRWETINLDTGESHQYRRFMSAMRDKAVETVVYGERWLTRRSTLPEQYWRLTPEWLPWR